MTYKSTSGEVIQVDDIKELPECPKGMKRKVLSQSSPYLAYFGSMFINYSECKSTLEMKTKKELE